MEEILVAATPFSKAKVLTVNTTVFRSAKVSFSPVEFVTVTYRGTGNTTSTNVISKS
jgi:hypothetical protein